MENSEILGFQFKSTKVLQPDSSLGKSWGTKVLGWEVLGETKHQLIICGIMSFNCSQIPATKECLCYHELNMCKYLKIRFYICLLTILQIFFIKLISEHSIVTLILIQNTKKQKVFFCFLLIYCILHNTISIRNTEVNTLICFVMRLMIPNHKTHQICHISD